MSDQGRTARGAGRSRWAAVGAAVAVTLGGGGFAVTHATSSSGERDVFVPIAPCRLFDTRPASVVGARNTPIGPGQTMVQTVRGTNGNCVIPGDASGVAMNVTVTNGTAAGYLTIWPSDAPLPLASSLNWTPASPPTPNKVDVKLSADGKISLFNNAGSIDVLADVVGFYVDHNHDDRYYSKAQIDAKLPASGVITIAGPAFQATDSRAFKVTDASGCSTVGPGLPGPTVITLDASISLPVGVTITSVTALIGNYSFGSVFGGVATLYRRTITGVTPLAVLDTNGLPTGLQRRTASLAVAELTASGAYYFIRFSPNALGVGSGTSVCGAEVAYTTPG